MCTRSRSRLTSSLSTGPVSNAYRHEGYRSSEVNVEITHVFSLNREYWVMFDGVWASLPWAGTPPVVGANAQFIVDCHLDATRRVLLHSS